MDSESASKTVSGPVKDKHPLTPRLNANLTMLAPLIKRMLSAKIPDGSELGQVRLLLLEQLVQARVLGNTLPLTFSHVAGALPVSAPGYNLRLLEAGGE